MLLPSEKFDRANVESPLFSEVYVPLYSSKAFENPNINIFWDYVRDAPNNLRTRHRTQEEIDFEEAMKEVEAFLKEDPYERLA